jgi:1L-myo-inositol 1-phosphate cytidylyltransferase / CDP-L-myo-inositol myo-inositolphosphotransferase
MSNRVRHAIVLAAGKGDRFRNGSKRSKLLTPVAGTPLLIRTLQSAHRAGISDAHVVLGYDADHVHALAVARAPAGLALHFHVNPDWHEENGRSALQARDALSGRAFALLMGDHLFDPRALERLARADRRAGEVLLGVDRHTTAAEIVSEATKVKMSGDRISAIGKTIDPFDALDTGLFVCDASLFAALGTSCACGDTTLSAGVSRLARERMVRGLDLGRAQWCDVDTVADLAIAEALAEPAA